MRHTIVPLTPRRICRSDRRIRSIPLVCALCLMADFDLKNALLLSLPSGNFERLRLRGEFVDLRHGEVVH